MISGLASNTCKPSYGGTSEVNLPPASTGLHHLDAGRVGDDLVLLTEGRRDVHDPGAVLGGDVVGGEHPVGVRPAGEEVERRRVGRPTSSRAACTCAAPSGSSPSSRA